MSESTDSQHPVEAIKQNMEQGIDYAVRVVNDVASTITAVLDATSRMQEDQTSATAQNIMKSSFAFTSASITDFLTLSKTLLHAESAHDYYEIQGQFFRARTTATMAHIKQISEFAVPQKK